MLGYKQVKRFRWSDIIDINDNCDKDCGHSNSVKNVPDQVKGTYITSTPNESPRRTVPLNLLGSSRYGPTTPVKKTTPANPVIDAEVFVEQKESTVWSKSRKKPSIVDIDLDDDSDDDQEDNVVGFVKKVISQPHRHAESNHAGALNVEVLPKTFEELKPDIKLDYQNQRWGIAETEIEKPMSKRKPDGDDKLADATWPQKMQVNKLNEIKLYSKLNADRQQNAPKGDKPARVCSSDSSNSDVEEVPLVFSAMSSIKKDLDSQNNKVQKTVDMINDARRVSVITSKVNSVQNVARSPRAENMESTGILLPKLGSKCNINQAETPKKKETLIDSQRTSDFTPKVNGERNEARSSSPDTIDEWLAQLDAKYFSTPKLLEKLHDLHHVAQSSKPHITEGWLSKYKTDQLKSQEKLRETVQEPQIVSKVDTGLDTTREWLPSLEAEYLASPQKTQGNLSNARHISNIIPKVNDERKYVFTVESKNEKVVPKTQDQLDGVLQESAIPKNNSETDKARSYLPTDARDWLSKLDAEYKTASKKQEDLNNALMNASKVNDKPNEHGSTKPNSVDHLPGEMQSGYNAEQLHMRQQESNTNQESNTLSKDSREKGEARSHILETAAPRLSKLDSKTEQPTQEVNNLSNANNGQNETRSFKFNTPDDLMMKLGFRFGCNRQEGQVNNSSEQKHEDRKSEDKDVKLPALTTEQKNMVESGLKPEPEYELLVKKFNMRIHRRDLRTLADEVWLNDAVINFYMNLIMQRSEERKDLPKVYATNTFFYHKLMASGQAGLSRWTRKVDIFAFDLFIVPINIDRHWCLSLVDFRTREVKYLDSRGYPNEECLKALMQYLKDEHQDKKGAPFDDSGWKAVCLTDIPQQMNGSDCGMFACTFAEFSSRDAAYSFTQAHMPYLRRKAALEILTAKLLL